MSEPELVSCTFDSSSPDAEAHTVLCNVHKQPEPQVVACTFDATPTGDKTKNDDEKCKKKKGASCPSCPKCGKSDNVVKIIFGMPTPELVKEEEEGKIALGGCCPPMPGDPPRDYKCKACKDVF